MVTVERAGPAPLSYSEPVLGWSPHPTTHPSLGITGYVGTGAWAVAVLGASTPLPLAGNLGQAPGPSGVHQGPVLGTEGPRGWKLSFIQHLGAASRLRLRFNQITCMSS